MSATTFVGPGGAVPTSLIEDQVSVANPDTPEPIVGVSTPCLAVWLGPPHEDSDDGLNSAVVYVGGESPRVPLEPDDPIGVVIAIDDAAKIHIMGATADKVNYMIIA